jgi:ribosomal protein L29
MKMSEIKALPNKELVERYKAEVIRLQKMKFQHAVTQLDQPHTLGETRKTIARMLTELNARRAEAEAQAYLKQMSEEN